MGCEITHKMQLGRCCAPCNGILAFIHQMMGNLHYSFGDDRATAMNSSDGSGGGGAGGGSGEAGTVDPLHELPHIVTPFVTSCDRLVVTPAKLERIGNGSGGGTRRRRGRQRRRIKKTEEGKSKGASSGGRERGEAGRGHGRRRPRWWRVSYPGAPLLGRHVPESDAERVARRAGSSSKLVKYRTMDDVLASAYDALRRFDDDGGKKGGKGGGYDGEEEDRNDDNDDDDDDDDDDDAGYEYDDDGDDGDYNDGDEADAAPSFEDASPLVTFSINTMYLDLTRWVVCKLPMVRSMNAADFWSSADIQFVMYDVPAASSSSSSSVRSGDFLRSHPSSSSLSSLSREGGGGAGGTSHGLHRS